MAHRSELGSFCCSQRPDAIALCIDQRPAGIDSVDFARKMPKGGHAPGVVGCMSEKSSKTTPVDAHSSGPAPVVVDQSTAEPFTTGTRRIRTALFVDFDNLFSGLFNSDRNTAVAFGEKPELWLKRLETYGLIGARRDLLVRRAYLNPEGTVVDKASGNSSGRLRLASFRSSLTRAGFEVVDCPPLSASQKNAADIRMVLDARDLLDLPVTYDEFIIASSDSDFTPLINRLRALDRRTVIMATGESSTAYRSVAHQVLDGRDVAALTRTKVGRPEPVAVDQRIPRDEAIKVIRRLVNPAAGNVHLSQVGKAVRTALADGLVDETKWFGERTLGGFLRVLPDGFAIDGHFVRHPATKADNNVGTAPARTQPS